MIKLLYDVCIIVVGKVILDIIIKMGEIYISYVVF